MAKENVPENKIVLLVDGSALVHRAFHAYPALTSRSGELVNAVYGFASIFMSTVEALKPSHVAVAWDTGRPTFRHEQYVAYKAQRPKTDDGLKSQMPKVLDMVGAMGVYQAVKEGYEADDIIGSLAKRLENEVMQVAILTGDQDTMQLVTGTVNVFTPGKSPGETKVYTPEIVKMRYGVTPEQMVDYKALIGDPSDNIPGVAGIGPKTASTLLMKYGSLDGVYENLVGVETEVGSRVAKLLEDGKESAYLSRDLSQIECDLKVAESLDELAFSGFDSEGTREAFQELGFQSLIRRVFGEEKKEDKQMGLF